VNARLRRLVGVAQTGADGLLLRHWRNRDLADARCTPVRQADLRMLPLAAAGWGAAWLGTGGAPSGIAAAAAGATVALVVAGWRRSAMLLTVALVIAAIASTAFVGGYQLRHGPVAHLAAHEAIVSADLEVRTDPHRIASKGTTPAAGVMKAVTVRVEGRGQTWLVRTPVLVVISGQHREQWLRLPVGTRVAADGRAGTPDRSSDVGAVLSMRSSPVVIEEPSRGLRLVERVRAGLRRAVADRPPEPRGLVPALVLGDTSGLDAELTRDFQTTGLTHLSIRSRHEEPQWNGRDLHADQR
jgi:competence protein ComEC